MMWGVAVAALGLGALLVPVPGIPGAGVALLGAVALAVGTDFVALDRAQLALATWISAVGLAAQLAAPVWRVRAWTRSVGAAGGAAVGVALGAMTPVPLATAAGALVGAIGGGLLGSLDGQPAWSPGRPRGFAGALFARGGAVTGSLAGGCGGLLVGVLADAVAYLGVAAVLGWAAYGA